MQATSNTLNIMKMADAPTIVKQLFMFNKAGKCIIKLIKGASLKSFTSSI